MMILSTRGSSSLDFSSIPVGMISGFIIHFITCMICALTVIYTKENFKYNILDKRQKIEFNYLVINKFVTLFLGTELVLGGCIRNLVLVSV